MNSTTPVTGQARQRAGARRSDEGHDDARAGIGDGWNAAVEDALVFGHQRQVRHDVEGDAGRDVGGDVELAAIGEQAGIFAEGGHPERRLAADADAQRGRDLPLDAGAQTAAVGQAGAVVGQVERIGREGRQKARREEAGEGESELGEAFRLEHLYREDRRDADRDRAEALGEARGDEHLLEIDAGLAAAEHAADAIGRRERIEHVLIGRVHAAIAEHGHAPGGVPVDRHGIGEVRHQEVIVGAVDPRRLRNEGAGRGQAAGAGRGIAAEGHEHGHAAGDHVRQIDEAGRVDRKRHRVLRIGDAGAGLRLLHRAVARLEIAFRR